MQIAANEIRKCVAFIASKAVREEERATVFFVSQGIGGEPKEYVSFAVTAAHVIEGIDQPGNDGNTYLRLNTREHGAQHIAVPLSKWVKHDSSAVDIAVAPFDLDHDVYDHLCLPEELYLTDEIVASHKVEAGSDLFFPGLFDQHVHTSANIPIIRAGTIAAMPGEPVNTTRGPTRAYLAEVRSIGGLSGSPVFVNVGWPYDRAVYFIGLLKGHFYVGSLAKQINTGIGIVIPADTITTVIAKPEFNEYRQTAELDWKRKNGLGH
ncbi:MAG: hypothetical protein WD851_01570 [Pirellulales bacterium]